MLIASTAEKASRGLAKLPTERPQSASLALEKFEAQDKQKAELVKLRYFVGMTIEEAAEVLGISVPTAQRHWAYARAWLAEEIKAGALNELKRLNR